MQEFNPYSYFSNEEADKYTISKKRVAENRGKLNAILSPYADESELPDTAPSHGCMSSLLKIAGVFVMGLAFDAGIAIKALLMLLFLAFSSVAVILIICIACVLNAKDVYDEAEDDCIAFDEHLRASGF